jgi:hypothetical protein
VGGNGPGHNIFGAIFLRSWFLLIATGMPGIDLCQSFLKNTLGRVLFLLFFCLVTSRRIIFGVQHHDVFSFRCESGLN